MSNALATTHPKNGYDVTLTYDEDYKLTSAVYDDGEDVGLNASIKAQFQADIDTYCRH